jgi:hypothetical protein
LHGDGKKPPPCKPVVGRITRKGNLMEFLIIMMVVGVVGFIMNAHDMKKKRINRSNKKKAMDDHLVRIKYFSATQKVMGWDGNTQEKWGQIYLKCIGSMPNKRIERDGGEQLSSNQVPWPPPLMLVVTALKTSSHHESRRVYE